MEQPGRRSVLVTGAPAGGGPVGAPVPGGREETPGPSEGTAPARGTRVDPSRAPPLRFGILGAARIAPEALLRPASRLPEARVVALAARDPGRARRFAARHGIPRVHPDYAALLSDPEIDAVYNPLPNALHCDWTIRALEAGKHVLCEKPMASNAREAERMAAVSRETGRVLVEAFHYRYHPLAERIQQVVSSGVLGRIRHIEAHICFPLPFFRNIRYRLDLAGGATMDVGCYAINLLRFLAGVEPEVTHAEARLASPRVDRFMSARFVFPGGCTGRATCSLFSSSLLRLSCSVVGEHGRMGVINPLAPHLFHRLRLETARGISVERLRGDSTYTCQLRAFVRMVRGGAPMSTDARDAIANMRVIDAVYRKAGLGPRGEASPAG